MMKKILIIKLRHHGDVLLTWPVFTALKNRYPDAVIDAYVYDECKEILSGHPAISRIYTKQKGDPRGVAWFFRELKQLLVFFKQKYDLVFNLTEGDCGAIVSFISRAQRRVGVHPRGTGFLGKKYCYTDWILYPDKPRHTVEKHLDALRVIDIFPDITERLLGFFIPEEAVNSMRVILKKATPYVLIHPGSRRMFKSLSVSQMEQIISFLLENGRNVVITGSKDPEEMAYVEKITAKHMGHSKLFSLPGQIDLKELGLLIREASLVICVDSLPFHLSSVFKKEVIAFFGPTSEETWGPWQNPSAHIVTSKISCRPCYRSGCAGSLRSDCLERIPVMRIKQLITEILAKIDASHRRIVQ